MFNDSLLKVQINGDKDDIKSFLCLIDTMHAYPLKRLGFEHYLSKLRPANLKSMCIILVSSLAQVNTNEHEHIMVVDSNIYLFSFQHCGC